jgi:hypothetical protein
MNLSLLWAVSVAAAVVGLCLVWWALLRDRPRGRPRCPFCWYDMRGTDSPRCPECGCEVLDRSRLFRTRRRWRIGMLGLLIVVCSMGYASYRHGRSAGWFDFLLPRWIVLQEQVVEGFRIRIMETRDQEAPDWRRFLRIDRDGETLFEIDGFYFTIGCDGNDGSQSLGLGQDITGDDGSNLVITEHSGGTGCYEWHYVFDLNSHFPHDGIRVIAVLNECGHFQDVTGDGYPEFIARDRTFSYRWTCGANSPYPAVILRWDGDRYAPAPHLMRKPPPEQEESPGLLAGFRNETETWEGRFSALLEIVLDLIYTGNESFAWKVLQEYWPKGEGGYELDSFRIELAEAVRGSPFRPAVEAVNRFPAPPSIPASDAP